MKLRHLLTAIALVAAGLQQPASAAPNGYAVNGDFSFDCFGCQGDNTGRFAGYVVGGENGPVFANFLHSSDRASGPACTASVTGSGYMSGAVSGAFTFTYTPPATMVVTFTASGTIWAGAATAAQVNCLGQTVTAFGGAGVVISF